ncbi:MAG: hypothetical protein HXX81_08010 [Campylobacterales bacterium]|nr:hypothetical protein [Campylobacterales bacterium]
MIRFIIVTLIFFILVWILLSKFTELRKTEKSHVLLTLFVVLFFGFIYTKIQDTKLKHNQQIIDIFDQNSSIYCHNFEVNLTNFNLVTGTLTFVGKNISNKHLIFPIEDCHLEKR